MTGILADHNLEGHVRNMVARMGQEPWREFWDSLSIGAFFLQDVGLTSVVPDDELWRVCQMRELVLITGNRNHDGPNSLDATILAENTPASLPVMTVSNPLALRNSRIYAEQVIEQLLDYLLAIERVRGTGRLYLP